MRRMTLALLPIVAGLGGIGFGLGMSPALAKNEIQKECSQKYQAAKAGNQLNGQTYNQYYKQCAADAKAEKTSPATPAPTPTTTAPAPAPAPAPTTTTTAAPRSMPGPAGAAVFPTALSPEFSKESAGKARMHTCLAQYKVNKTNNGNGGLRWIEKGGGYYSECNKRLKS